MGCGSSDLFSLGDVNSTLTHPFMTLGDNMYQRYASADKLLYKVLLDDV